MNNMNSTKIGLFGIGLDTYWPQFRGLLKRLNGYQEGIATRLRGFGVELVDAGMGVEPAMHEHRVAQPHVAAHAPQPVHDLLAQRLGHALAARRRARGEEGPPSENETANRGTQVAAASKTQPTITFGERPPTPSGGLFQIRRRGYDYAEFMYSQKIIETLPKAKDYVPSFD